MDPVMEMEPSRRFQYLSALGVTQYRRRSLTVLEPVSSPAQTDSHITDHSNQASAATDVGNATDIRANIAQTLQRTVAQPSAPMQQPSPGGIQDQLGSQSDSDSFDLLVWRSANILVLDFSNSESALAQAKHRLANNIMKALWPGAFTGADLHQHIWPMSGVEASADSARQWLGSLVAGHLQHEKTMPIWIMGEPGLKMLFPDQADFSDLEGSRVRHEQLAVELLISPCLSQILESTVAKAQTWQLLKSLR